MGTYFNPDNKSFTGDKISKIYVDKTGLLEYLNGVLGTTGRYLANSMIGWIKALNFLEFAISIPQGNATTTDQNHPTTTRAVDSKQFAHREPSLYSSTIRFATATGDGRNSSDTIPPKLKIHHSPMISAKQIKLSRCSTFM